MSRRRDIVALSSLMERGQAKWRSSGLSNAQAKELQFSVLEPEETGRLGANFLKLGALRIPYFDLAGELTGFYRVRYLEVPTTGFVADAKKPPRYVQPSGSLAEVYYPPLLPAAWSDIAADPKIPVFITEGELKAASACALGLATIGLGGVDNWRAKKRGLALLPSLEEFDWDGRQVTIIFDSDAATNPNVVRAERQLSAELLTRGAMPRLASLPPTPEGAKQGLDDFLVAYGAEALEEVLAGAEEFPEAQALWELNEEVVYVRDPGLVVVRASGQRMTPGNFVQHAYSNRHYLEVRQGKNGVQQTMKSAAKRWLEWEHRFSLQRVTYKPGKEQVHEDQWNMWPGWPITPKAGDVTPWHWLLGFLFGRETPEVRQWFEKWCAYPLQHPGAKMFSSAVLWGTHHGTGKTLVGYTLMRLYGQNAEEIKNADLRGGFNEWAMNKQFVYGDEITGSDKRIDADKIKGMITQEHLRVNAKYVPSYTVPDCINYLFTSNHPDAFFLEDTDRRFFVHEVRGAPAERAFYRTYDTWLRGEGPRALFHYLLNLDLGGFDPTEPALTTTSKQEMITDGKSDLSLWVSELRSDPTGWLAPLGARAATEADLFTAAQLLKAYDPEGSGRVTSNGVSRELKRAGFVTARGGAPIKTVFGAQRLFAVRNAEKWALASHAACAEHFNAIFGSGKY